MWVEIGNQLRQAREEAGLSLEDLRDQTQIDSVTLKRLESGEFDKISSPFYVRSHIRTYAKQVGLEPTYLLKKYRPIPDSAGQESTDSGAGAGSQQTSTYRPTPPHTEVQQTSSRESRPESTGPLPPTYEGGVNGSYDPYRTAYSEPNEETAVASETDPAEEALPSRSRSQKKRLSLTQTLKLPALKKKGDQRGRMEADPGVEAQEGAFSPGEEMPVPEAGLPSRLSSGKPRNHQGQASEVFSDYGGHESFQAEGSRSLFPEENGEPVEGAGEGGLSRMKRRTRTSGTRRKKGWSFPNKWVVRVSVIAAILLIPMTVWAYSNIVGNPSEAEQNAAGKGTDEVQATTADGSAQVDLIPVNQEGNIGEYKLSEPSAVHLQFKGKGTSWIQIRETKEQNGGYVKDVTLKSGESFPFKQPKSVNTDLWISIGSPDQVEVTVNGEPIDPKKTIHIIKNNNN